jgi:hypothetical protein
MHWLQVLNWTCAPQISLMYWLLHFLDNFKEQKLLNLLVNFPPLLWLVIQGIFTL